MDPQLVSSFARLKTLSSPEPEGESKVPDGRVTRRRPVPGASAGSGLILGLTSRGIGLVGRKD